MPLFPAWAVPTSTGTAQDWIYPSQTAASTASWYSSQLANSSVWTSQTVTSTTSDYFVYSTEGGLLEHAQYLGLARARAVSYQARVDEQRQRTEEVADRARQRHEAHRAATERSRDLLLAHLTPAQRKTFEENKWFIVQGGKTKQTYRIRTENYTGNIDVLTHGKVAYRLCAHCRDLPLYDHHLAQKISLECDEEYFLGIANRH